MISPHQSYFLRSASADSSAGFYNRGAAWIFSDTGIRSAGSHFADTSIVFATAVVPVLFDWHGSFFP